MFGFVTEGRGDPVFQSFCSQFRRNLMQLLKQRAVVLHRTHLALGISRKVLMCFLGIPSLLSRNSPLSFPGICTVPSRKCQLLLSIYISSSLSRIIPPHFFLLCFFPVLHHNNFLSIHRNCCVPSGNSLFHFQEFTSGV